MRDEEMKHPERLSGGRDLPLPGIKTATDMEGAEEHFLEQDVALEGNELHAAGRVCTRCGRKIGPEDDVRRTASGAYQHELCDL
jgi:hypothetical protein